MKINWTEILTEAARDNSLQVRSYSGRNMHGRECLGITTDGGAFRLLGSLCGILPDYVAEEDLSEALVDLGELIEGTQEDSMGRSTIVYWPKLAAPEKDTEVDGEDEDEEG